MTLRTASSVFGLFYAMPLLHSGVFCRFLPRPAQGAPVLCAVIGLAGTMVKPGALTRRSPGAVSAHSTNWPMICMTPCHAPGTAAPLPVACCVNPGLAWTTAWWAVASIPVRDLTMAVGEWTSACSGRGCHTIILPDDNRKILTWSATQANVIKPCPHWVCWPERSMPAIELSSSWLNPLGFLP